MSNVRQKGSFLFSHCFGNCKQNLEHSHAAASSLTVNQTPNLYVVYIYIKGRKSFVSKNSRKCQMGLSFTCTASPVHLINSNDCSIKWLLSTEAAPDAPLWLPQAGFWQQPTCLCAFCRSRRKAPGRGGGDWSRYSFAQPGALEGRLCPCSPSHCLPSTSISPPQLGASALHMLTTPT